MEENASNVGEALTLIHQRNDFYKKKYFWMLGTYILSWVAIVVLVSIFFYIAKNPTRPLFFVADQVGKFIPDIPTNRPNMTEDEVINWTIEAVESANSFDFVNYRAELQNAQKYFTNYMWGQYMKTLTASNNLLALAQRKWIFVAKVTDKPKLLKEGLVGDAYAWKFEMPLLVRYLRPPAFDMKTSIANANVVTVIVVRQNLLQSYRGLAVVSMVITAASAPSSLKVMPSA